MRRTPPPPKELTFADGGAKIRSRRDGVLLHGGVGGVSEKFPRV